MKTFLQFITESTATQQAARLGLQSDGHGGWTDRTTGEFVAKTEKGRLKFFNKRQKVGGKDPAQTEKEKNISDPNFNDPALQQQQPITKEVHLKSRTTATTSTKSRLSSWPPVPKQKEHYFRRQIQSTTRGHLQLMALQHPQNHRTW